MTIPTLETLDPASDDAKACLSAYIAELDAVFPEGFDPGPMSEADLAMLRPPLGAFVVARLDGTAIGCVALRRRDQATGEVKRLWVARGARRLGLARRLMVRIEAEARGLGYARLVLDTSRHLPEAVAFYRRWGWREIARYNDNAHAHHFFELDLS